MADEDSPACSRRPVIIVIGLGLASTAVNMAMYDDPNASELVYSLKHFSVAGVTLAITIICAIFLRGFLSLIPVLIGIIGGYLFALTQGIVNFQPVLDAKWFAVPEFIIPFKDYSPSVTLGIAYRNGSCRICHNVRAYLPPNGAEQGCRTRLH